MYHGSIPEAIIRAVDQGCDVISISYIGLDRSAATINALNYATANGVIVVWAQGGNSDYEYWIGSWQAVRVSSHDKLGSRWYSRGNIEFSSPGKSLYSISPSGFSSYIVASGNSLATPLTAAAAALLMKKNPSWNVFDIRQALRVSARSGDGQTENWDKNFGWGCVNINTALSLTLDDLGVMSPEEVSVSGTGTTTHTISWNTGTQTRYAYTVVVRTNKSDGPASTPTDGEVVYSGTGSSVELTDVPEGEYYYSVFNRDIFGNWSDTFGDTSDSDGLGTYSFDEAISFLTEKPAGSPIADFEPSTTQEGIVDFPVQFTDTSEGDIVSWHWDFGDGKTSTLQNPNHLYTTTGSFDVSLTVSGSDGTDTITRESLIIVNPGGSISYPNPYTKGLPRNAIPIIIETKSDNLDYSKVKIWLKDGNDNSALIYDGENETSTRVYSTDEGFCRRDMEGNRGVFTFYPQNKYKPAQRIRIEAAVSGSEEKSTIKWGQGIYGECKYGSTE